MHVTVDRLQKDQLIGFAEGALETRISVEVIKTGTTRTQPGTIVPYSTSPGSRDDDHFLHARTPLAWLL